MKNGIMQRSYMDKGISLARIAGADSVVMSDFYIQYYNIYKEIGNYEDALKYYEKAIENQSELLSSETAAKISELKEKYETTQKEQELELMREKERVSTLELEEKETKIRERTYSLIALGILLIAIIIWMYYHRKHKLLKIEKHAVQLEHKALRAQMNPHFLFNSLNSIQRMYVEGNENDANEYMADFAELMRKILDNSGQNTISLHEELTALKLYLNLEQLRCQNKISYSIHVDEHIDTHNTSVPPLIIQPFVENAIWHGILPKKESGHIAINISQEKHQIKCKIHDDGVGFSPESTTQHESKGIRITEQRIGNKIIIESTPNQGTTVSFYIKNS